VTQQNFPPEFLAKLAKVTGQRSRIVVDHILANGFITTEDLKVVYGYNHPPRAIKDVRDQGIPLETYSVKNSEGRKIAAYRFGDPSQVRGDRFQGRGTFPKSFKEDLIREYGCQCSICCTKYESRYLQIDHCIPYDIAGDNPQAERKISEYMLLCGSCQRAKSWSCENCVNSKEEKSPKVCEKCYWANTDSYTHVALRQIRKLDIVWYEDEVDNYTKLQAKAEESDVPLPDYVKKVIKKLTEEE
jgi:5-methylcytosine-specific restriction endonuclease McrA